MKKNLKKLICTDLRFDSSMVREHVQIANLQTMTADLFLPNLNMQLPDYKWCCQACHLLMKITKITSVKRSQFTGVNLLLSKNPNQLRFKFWTFKLFPVKFTVGVPDKKGRRNKQPPKTEKQSKNPRGLILFTSLSHLTCPPEKKFLFKTLASCEDILHFYRTIIIVSLI